MDLSGRLGYEARGPEGRGQNRTDARDGMHTVIDVSVDRRGISRAERPPPTVIAAAAILRRLAPLNSLLCLLLLLDGEKCVGQLQEAMGRSQSHVSQILRVLRRQGLVRVRHVRNSRCYSLADTPETAVLRGLAGRLGLHPGAHG